MKEIVMSFSFYGESLRLEYDNDEGMFIVTLGPESGGTHCTVGTHCEYAMAVEMFNHEVQAMQSKWKEDT